MAEETFSTTRSRAWCGTWNNYTDADYDRLTTDEHFTYIVCGKEICPTTGTPHLQFYVRLKSAAMGRSMKKRYPLVSWRKAHGTCKDNQLYCSKGEGVKLPTGGYLNHGLNADVFERGEPCESSPHEKGGAANAERWQCAKNSAISGSFEEIDPEICIKYYNNLKLLQRDYQVVPDRLPDGHQVGYWYWGESRTGKSHAARAEYPFAYLKHAETKWWDGYAGEEAVIIDDFDKYHVKQGHSLKLWGDYYPFPAEVKGSSMKIRPKVVIITSNYHPKQIWEDQATIEPLLQRFKVVHFGNWKEGQTVDERGDEVRQAYSRKRKNVEEEKVPDPVGFSGVEGFVLPDLPPTWSPLRLDDFTF